MKLFIKKLYDGVDIKFDPEDQVGIYLDDLTCQKLGHDVTQAGLSKEKFTEIEVNITINSSVG